MMPLDDSISIREAIQADFSFVSDLMNHALEAYYGGDHIAHAERIFSAHLSGGKDQLGFFSFEQKIFIITYNGVPAGMINIVGKRQGTYKISPLITSTSFPIGLGKRLLDYAENYARSKGGRQIYCTVAEPNRSALIFFLNNGYTIAGRSDSHFKSNVTEIMLYKLFKDPDYMEKFDRHNISVHQLTSGFEYQVRDFLLNTLPDNFRGIDSTWVDSLFEGYHRSRTKNINQKYKLIYIAIDRDDRVLGVVGATPKKSERPIKLMPFHAVDIPSFTALLTDVPYFLKPYGCKLYVHISPNVDQTIVLQQLGWKLDAVLPAAYHEERITQQWSLNIAAKGFMRLIRTKQRYLDLIKQGGKTIEIRVGYENIRTIEPGEKIKFRSHSQTAVALVEAIRIYKDFDEMLNNEDPSSIIPDLPKEDILDILKGIYPDKLERLGVVAIQIKAKLE